MCNWIRPKNFFYLPGASKKLRKTGRGYKWVVKTKSSLYSDKKCYRAPVKKAIFEPDKTAVWGDIGFLSSVHEGDGFTFFLTKKEALSVQKSLCLILNQNEIDNLVLVRIKYGGGLISRDEPDPLIDTRIGLCTELTIVEEVKL